MAKAIGPKAKTIKIGLKAKAWPRGLHHCQYLPNGKAYVVQTWYTDGARISDKVKGRKVT